MAASWTHSARRVVATATGAPEYVIGPDETKRYLHCLLTSRGGVFTPECLESWLGGAGCVDIRRYSLRAAPGLLLLTGRKRDSYG